MTYGLSISDEEPLLWRWRDPHKLAQGIVLHTRLDLETYFRDVQQIYFNLRGQELNISLQFRDFTLIESSAFLTLRERKEYLIGVDPLDSLIDQLESGV